MKKLISLILAVCLLFAVTVPAFADRVDPEGYLILGADLSQEQTKTVYDLMGVTDDSSYQISYTTNKEEHEALDSYLDSAVIGKRALSSILLLPGKKGSGITVEAYNISYCTVSMYQNALIDAGVEDCRILIAAPMSVSGTCALVSAMKGYATMTGEEIKEESADAALDELVTTGQVGELVGDNDKAAELIAALKQKMLEEDLDEKGLGIAIDLLCKEMHIKLDAETRTQIIQLMLKLKKTDIDVGALKEQAAALYEKVNGVVASLDVDTQAANSFLSKIIQAVVKMFGGLLKK